MSKANFVDGVTTRFEVTQNMDGYTTVNVVDIAMNTCTCVFFLNERIACKHAFKVAMGLGWPTERILLFFDSRYRKENFCNAYNQVKITCPSEAVARDSRINIEHVISNRRSGRQSTRRIRSRGE